MRLSGCLRLIPGCVTCEGTVRISLSRVTSFSSPSYTEVALSALSGPVGSSKPEESHQGAGGGGREGKLLVVATEEGQELGLSTPVRAAAGGGEETSPQATAPQWETYWIGGETSVNGGTS